MYKLVKIELVIGVAGSLLTRLVAKRWLFGLRVVIIRKGWEKPPEV
jgi:hypothetical protein